jgi:hypothetical protein
MLLSHTTRLGAVYACETPCTSCGKLTMAIFGHRRFGSHLRRGVCDQMARALATDITDRGARLYDLLGQVATPYVLMAHIGRLREGSTSSSVAPVDSGEGPLPAGAVTARLG